MGNCLVNHRIIGTPEPMRNMLNEVWSLGPKGINYITKQLLLVASNEQSVQTAVKIPISTIYSVTNGNRSQQSVSGIWSGKRYERNKSQIL